MGYNTSHTHCLLLSNLLFRTPMRKTTPLYLAIGILLFASCKKKDDGTLQVCPPSVATCPSDNSLDVLTQRNFKMGFSTWSYGPKLADKDATYQFISSNADLYSEQIDDKIPWKAWINNTSLPVAFTDEIADRVARRLGNLQLALSVSLLNTDRNDLLEDYDGSRPSYTSLDEQQIEDAYFSHLDYLIGQFNPNYLILSMEANDLLVKSPGKWSEYKLLMGKVRTRVKSKYPNLLLSESMTLHNWFNPDVSDPAGYIAEIENYTQQLDFVAISFYPFFKGLTNKTQFQQAFDFLHSKVSKPIAFVETTHLAETLELTNQTIVASECEQQEYLEVLLLNAHKENYRFLVWWSFHDYDALWQTFPDNVKEIGKIWRDTGLFDENGTQRPGFNVWSSVFEK